MNSSYVVYIVTNKYRTTLYIGVTNNIQKRLLQHYKSSLQKTTSFTGKYNCYFLVYYEIFDDINEAILREKQLKKWRREKKNNLVSSFNPKWETLNNQIM